MNQLILVGQLVEDPTVETRQGEEVVIMKLSVKNMFKNGHTGKYDTPVFEIQAWSGIADSIMSYCKKNTTLGIKARLGVEDYVVDDVKAFSYPIIIAEKVTFINQKREVS